MLSVYLHESFPRRGPRMGLILILFAALVGLAIAFVWMHR